MSKQIASPAAGSVARRQNRKPSAVATVVSAAVEAPVAAAPAQVAPVPAPAPAPAAVALRGGLAVVAVALGKPYRVQAGHNLQWLTQVQAACAAGGGSASVQALLAAGVPAPFVGYMVRRGYAVPVAAK